MMATTKNLSQNSWYRDTNQAPTDYYSVTDRTIHLVRKYISRVNLYIPLKRRLAFTGL
jgi:hypothetical protein